MDKRTRISVSKAFTKKRTIRDEVSTFLRKLNKSSNHGKTGCIISEKYETLVFFHYFVKNDGTIKINAAQKQKDNVHVLTLNCKFKRY